MKSTILMQNRLTSPHQRFTRGLVHLSLLTIIICISLMLFGCGGPEVDVQMSPKLKAAPDRIDEQEKKLQEQQKKDEQKEAQRKATEAEKAAKVEAARKALESLSDDRGIRNNRAAWMTTHFTYKNPISRDAEPHRLALSSTASATSSSDLPKRLTANELKSYLESSSGRITTDVRALRMSPTPGSEELRQSNFNKLKALIGRSNQIVISSDTFSLPALQTYLEQANLPKATSLTELARPQTEIVIITDYFLLNPGETLRTNGADLTIIAQLVEIHGKIVTTPPARADSRAIGSLQDADRFLSSGSVQIYASKVQADRDALIDMRSPSIGPVHTVMNYADLPVELRRGIFESVKPHAIAKGQKTFKAFEASSLYGPIDYFSIWGDTLTTWPDPRISNYAATQISGEVGIQADLLVRALEEWLIKNEEFSKSGFRSSVQMALDLRGRKDLWTIDILRTLTRDFTDTSKPLSLLQTTEQGTEYVFKMPPTHLGAGREATFSPLHARVGYSLEGDSPVEPGINFQIPTSLPGIIVSSKSLGEWVKTTQAAGNLRVFSLHLLDSEIPYLSQSSKTSSTSSASHQIRIAQTSEPVTAFKVQAQMTYNLQLSSSDTQGKSPQEIQSPIFSETKSLSKELKVQIGSPESPSAVMIAADSAVAKALEAEFAKSMIASGVLQPQASKPSIEGLDSVRPDQVTTLENLILRVRALQVADEELDRPIKRWIDAYKIVNAAN